jgi:hypothetical protein
LDNIRIIETGIDVSKIKAQLEQYPEDWNSVRQMEGTAMQDPSYNLVSADVLQLVVGGLKHEGDFIGDSEICITTPAFYKHTEIVRWSLDRFNTFARCAFLALPVGKIVGKHIDRGRYYLKKDRYHLSIQGRYKYMVGDEEVIVEPGTFLWFNNKVEHGTENIGDEVRITFVIDAPHHPTNP